MDWTLVVSTKPEGNLIEPIPIKASTRIRERYLLEEAELGLDAAGIGHDRIADRESLLIIDGLARHDLHGQRRLRGRRVRLQSAGRARRIIAGESAAWPRVLRPATTLRSAGLLLCANVDDRQHLGDAAGVVAHAIVGLRQHDRDRSPLVCETIGEARALQKAVEPALMGSVSVETRGHEMLGHTPRHRRCADRSYMRIC